MMHCGLGGHLDASVSHVEGGGQVPSVCMFDLPYARVL